MKRYKWFTILLEACIGIIGILLILYSIQLVLSDQQSIALFWFIGGLILLTISGLLQCYDHHMGKQRR